MLKVQGSNGQKKLPFAAEIAPENSGALCRWTLTPSTSR